MKNIFLIGAVMISLAACKSSDKKTTPAQLTPEEKAKALTDTANFTTIQWLDSTYKDLGKLKADQTVEITYRFKNSGTKNLIIDNVSAQCGCTIPEKPEKKPEIGVAIGLAWTGMGGDLMMIEGLRMKGSGEVITTGSLGEVMKESIQAAHSYVRSKADTLGIDHNDFDNFDIHIHFPSGAIPKDGPSAGVTVSLVVASVMAERPIRHDIAMTGEVTLRGRVLPVGGIKEKISAAYRAGIPKILIPIENKKDLKDLPDDILKKTKFIFIETVDEVFEAGLLDFVPSSYTLEKLFAEELEKAKHRKNNVSHRRVAAKGMRRK